MIGLVFVMKSVVVFLNRFFNCKLLSDLNHKSIKGDFQDMKKDVRRLKGGQTELKRRYVT